MISSLDDLRKHAVRHILRQGSADYLLRHALGKPWIASSHHDEMAWTDFKSLFFNFPKLRAQLDQWSTCAFTGTNTGKLPLDPGEEVVAFLAAACHEITHVLWLHKYRSKDKERAPWRDACEYAINYEMVRIFGLEWIHHLGVMYPNDKILEAMENQGLPRTTDGFYELLITFPKMVKPAGAYMVCHFCDRCMQEEASEEETDPTQMVRLLHQLPETSPERDDILKFITAQYVTPQKVPWEMLMLGGVEDAVSKEQSWMRPSRRDDMLPSWRHEKLLSFIWILDVSPSIDDEMKRSFMSTVQAGINLYHDAQHRVIFFAEGVVEDITISSGTNISGMEVPSGTGTSLVDVWKILEEDRPEYALVLTDLELAEVPKPSFTKIIWGIVGDYRIFDPDYGTKIVLN